ncbi:MAG: DUF86 domain-containing protein [Deltaproteobacteria bacterium]|nr:DUF86 domain-containing protein [Deltaproteobacteria bacterium]
MKDDRLYLIHISECIGRIERFVFGGKESFMASDLIQGAVLRNLQVMAESTKRLSDSLKAKKPEGEWTGIAGFRNVLVNDYFDIDLDEVWNIVELDLPVLKRQVEELLKELGGA